VINSYLVRDLAARGLWDYQMLDDLKYFDGSIQPIERIPDDLKERYLTAFEAEVDRYGTVTQPLCRRAKRPAIE
jgi:ribonucleoside-diphosphate reductase alpha chain